MSGSPGAGGRPTVLLVHHTFPGVIGGVETVMGQHAAGLRERAHVRLLAGRGPVGVRGVEAVRIPLVDSRHPSVLPLSSELAAGRVPATFDRLRARLRDTLAPHFFDADRVVLHNVVTLGLNLPLVAALHDLGPTLPAGRLVVWVHDLATADPRHAARLHPGEPWSLLSAPLPGARYVAVSPVRQAQVATLLGLPVDSVRVVGNGVDLSATLRISPATLALTGRLGLADADPLLLLPARLVRRKRIELAIDAAAELRARGRPARLVVTGGPDPHDPEARGYLRELRTRVAEAGGRDRLLCDALGRSASRRLVDDLYSLADALVFPSIDEGFGLPVIEAAVHRLPIVCTDLPTLRALVGPGATYVDPGASGGAFADAVEAALDRAGAPPAGRVRRRLDWGRIVSDEVIPAIFD